MKARFHALRRAWREFCWMVVTPPKAECLGRRAWLGIAFRNARCGLITGGAHQWGPLVYEYEGARLRRQKCRWCRASRTPAEEMAEALARVPLGVEEVQRLVGARKPTDEEVQRALKRAEEAGIYRNGKFVWD